MKKIRVATLGVGLILMGIAATISLAANPLPVTVTIPASTTITVNTALISWNPPAFTTGAYLPTDVSVTAQTNKKGGYTISARATDAAFTADAEGDAASFPLSRLEVDPGSGFAAITNSDQSVHSGAKTGATPDTFNVSFRLNLSGNEASGVYTNSITFTIAAP